MSYDDYTKGYNEGYSRAQWRGTNDKLDAVDTLNKQIEKLQLRLKLACETLKVLEYRPVFEPHQYEGLRCPICGGIPPSSKLSRKYYTLGHTKECTLDKSMRLLRIKSGI